MGPNFACPGETGSLGQAVFGKPLWELYIDDWEKSTDGFFKFCLQHGNSGGPLVNLVSDHFPRCFTLLLNFQKPDKFHDADWDVALVRRCVVRCFSIIAS